MTTRDVVIVTLFTIAACGDNDHPGGGQLLVSPQMGLHTTEFGGTAQFTVSLSNEPIDDLAVGITSSNPAEGTVSPVGLVFTKDNFATPQIVVVTGVDDNVVDGPQAYLIHISADGSENVDDVDVSVTNDDNDLPGVVVTPTLGLLTSESGGQATFTMSLLAQPAASVMVPLASSNGGEGTIDRASVEFTPDSWDQPQTVTITGVDDHMRDGQVAYTILTGLTVSDDPIFNGLDPDDVQVTNVDDEQIAIVVAPTSGLVTSESGGHDTFSVVLSVAPTDDVTIAVTSLTPGEAVAAPASLTFTTSNWNTPQTVTVTGQDDLVADGPEPFTIMLAPAVSTDLDYNGLDPDDVTGTNLDNDTAAIDVWPTSGLTTSETGTRAYFQVVLGSQPVANVTIPVTSSDLTEGTAFPASLLFTAADWNQPRTVTVKGVDDLLTDGNQAYTIVMPPPTTTDTVYAAIDPADVSVTNIDNETAGFTVTPTTLTVSEFGDSDTFTIVLNKRPTANVTITFASTDLTEGTVSPQTVTFSTFNWNTPRTITVTGVNDNLTDGNQTFTIVTNAALTTDPAYSGLDPANVSVTNIDNETAQVYVKARPLLTTSENGTTATFQMRLTRAPTASVTCPLHSSDLTEGTVTGSVTFTPGNFAFQTVTVTGVDDAIVDGDQLYSIITGPCTSTDARYNGFDPPDVACLNRDND